MLKRCWRALRSSRMERPLMLGYQKSGVTPSGYCAEALVIHGLFEYRDPLPSDWLNAPAHKPPRLTKTASEVGPLGG